MEHILLTPTMNSYVLMAAYLLGAMVCLFFAGAGFEYRQQKAVRIFMAIMIFYAGWMIMNLLMVFSVTLDEKEAFARLRFVFISQLPALWLFFGTELFRRPEERQNKWMLWPFFVIPTLVGLAAVLPEYHHLILHSVATYEAYGVPAVRWQLGPLGQLHLFYSYTVLILFAWVCFRGVRNTGPRKKRYLWMLATALTFFVIFDIVGIAILPQWRYLGIPILTQIISAFWFFYILQSQQAIQSFSRNSNRLFAALPTPVLLVDRQENLTLFNVRAGEIFGLNLSSVGNSLVRVLPESVLESLAEIGNGEKKVTVSIGQGEDERSYEVTRESIRHPMLLGEGALLVFSDITALRHSMQINQRLMSLMSHDLLGNLSGMAMLTQHHSERHWDLLRESAQSSVDLIKNILLWSSHEGDFYRCKKEPLQIGALVTGAISQAEPSLNSKQLRVQGGALSDETIVHVDQKMFQAILRNLLSNAIKHSPQSGKIEILSRVESGQVHLSILDEGPGFDLKKAKKILEQKERPSAEVASAEGFGIGLFLVNQFLRIHRGSLELSSSNERGGRVVIVFPA